MPTFYCNFFCLALGGPLHSGAPWTLPALPIPHCHATGYYKRRPTLSWGTKRKILTSKFGVIT